MDVPSAGVAGSAAPPFDHAVSCIAGFYADEAGQQRALRTLRDRHGLVESQWVTLGPRDAGAARFRWKSHRWTGGVAPMLFAPGLAIGLVVLALSMAALWWFIAFDLPPFLLALALLPVLLCGGGAGLAVATWWPPPRTNRRFETSVRQQLAAGRWALVVHRLSRSGQAGILDLLRTGSLLWCAAAAPMRRI